MRYQPFLNQLTAESSLPRNCGIPFDSKEDALCSPALLAPRCKTLNGVWMFRTFRRTSSVPVDFFSMSHEYEDWDGTPIPCILTGNDRSACFIREFELDSSWANGSILLHLDGAGPQTSVWVNGLFCGSVCMEEKSVDFDLTDTALPGVNRIAIQTDRKEKQGKTPFGIFGNISLLLQPTPGIWNATFRKKGKVLSAEIAIRHGEENTEELTVKAEFLDRQGDKILQKTLKQDKEADKPNFTFFHSSTAIDEKKIQSVRTVLLTLLSDRKLVDCHAVPVAFSGSLHDSVLQKRSFPAAEACKAPRKGPRRDPISLEDDGESLWLSATSGLMAEFSRSAGTLQSVDLDGISLMDQGPVPDSCTKLRDITLARNAGNVELAAEYAGISAVWTILRSGFLLFEGKCSPSHKVKFWEMLLPRSLCKVFCDPDEPIALDRDFDGEKTLKNVRKVIFCGIWNAGLAICSGEPVDIVLGIHKHKEEPCGCHHHEHHEDHEYEGLSLRISSAKERTLTLTLFPFASNMLDPESFLRSE